MPRPTSNAQSNIECPGLHLPFISLLILHDDSSASLSTSLQILHDDSSASLSASLPAGTSAWWNLTAPQQPLTNRTWEAFSPRVDMDPTKKGALGWYEKVCNTGPGVGS